MGRREIPGCLDPKRLAEGISVETGQPGVDHAQRGRHNSDLWREPIASALAPVAPSRRRPVSCLSPLGVACLAVRSATVHRAALHCLSAQEGAPCPASPSSRLAGAAPWNPALSA